MSGHLIKARMLHRAIRETLMEKWDPIGVKGIPEAQDEYDSYVPAIYKMLIPRKGKDEIFDYIWRVETEYMGMKGNRLQTEIIAEKLRSLVE